MFTSNAWFKKLIARKEPIIRHIASLSVYAVCHDGDREENQDAYDVVVEGVNGFFIVADGMGGHTGGRLASLYFTKALKNTYLDQMKPVDHPEQSLKEMISNARMEMCQQVADEAPELLPHTTCVCAMIQQSQLWVAHVGDSRMYLIENENITWHTRDHSIAQLMVDEGELDVKEVPEDNSQNMLFRSINCDKIHPVSIKHFQNVQPNSSLLLCSDGLWQYIDTEEIILLNGAVEPQAALQQSVDNAYQRANGKADNITALLIKIM